MSELYDNIFMWIAGAWFFLILLLTFLSLFTWNRRYFTWAGKLFGFGIIVLIVGSILLALLENTEISDAPSAKTFNELSHDKQTALIKGKVAELRAQLSDQEMVDLLDQVETTLNKYIAESETMSGDHPQLTEYLMRFYWLDNEFYKITRWSQRNFINEWGDPTPNIYLSNKYEIKGDLTNNWGQNASCELRFMIDYQKSPIVSFFLYDYFGAKVTGSDSFPQYYAVQIIGDSDASEIRAFNLSDRITFSAEESKNIIKIFENNPIIRILIKNIGNEFDKSKYIFKDISTMGFDRSYKYYLVDVALLEE